MVKYPACDLKKLKTILRNEAPVPKLVKLCLNQLFWRRRRKYVKLTRQISAHQGLPAI
jgi:hypothetical protein